MMWTSGVRYGGKLKNWYSLGIYVECVYRMEVVRYTSDKWKYLDLIGKTNLNTSALEVGIFELILVELISTFPSLIQIKMIKFVFRKWKYWQASPHSNNSWIMMIHPLPPPYLINLLPKMKNDGKLSCKLNWTHKYVCMLYVHSTS